MNSPSSAAIAIVNISAYKFVALADIDTLRERLLAECQRLTLKGTVLLAPEGINLFLAGSREAIDGIVAWLHADARFADLAPKESLSGHQPFRKMLVKKKREIITMNHPAIAPESGRAPAVDAPTLKRWLDQGHDDAGREVLMVDTRNAFEVDYGAFENCLDWRIEKFSDFPAAASAHADELAGKTVVTYCTGGIRCEKAVLVMQEAGIPNVLQLDGGILKYFEEVGGSHYRGECFVFDEREALDPGLAPTTQPRR
ncbi:sulfurtransferase [Uliginosibacterium sp. H1]|uniref:sulfurtransferase n=1 Tax=Uliginosibacterium sp. H1 TaxID=3114757 RepID=UPI002E18EDD2|nr:sulfurtransferase [Uliginosibacterium sp. H1]